MLQKIVNGIAIISGVVSLTVVGTVGYVYVRKDAIIENVKGKVLESVLPAGIGGAVGGPALLVEGGTDGAPSAPKSVHSDSVGSLWLVAMTLVRDCVVEKDRSEALVI